MSRFISFSLSHFLKIYFLPKFRCKYIQSTSLKFGIIRTCVTSLNETRCAFRFFFNACFCFSCTSTNRKNCRQIVHGRTMIKRFIRADAIFPNPQYDRRSKNMMPYPMVSIRESPHMASSSNSFAFAQRFLSSR